MTVIDAHHHFWRVAAQDQPWRDDSLHGAIARDYGPADLETEIAAAGVQGTVLIQSVDEPAENDRLVAYLPRGTLRGCGGRLVAVAGPGGGTCRTRHGYRSSTESAA